MNEPSASETSAPLSPPPKRRGGFFRKLFKLVLLLLVLVGLSPLLLKLGFVRDFVAKKASAAAGVPVSFRAASAWWTSGLDVEGLVIGSPPGHDGDLATVEKIHVDVGLWKLVRGHVDASVTVTKPTLMLRRNASGQWNLQDLLQQRAQPGSGAAAENEPPAAPAQGGTSPGLKLELVDGAVEAHGLSGRVERISDIDVSTVVEPSGAMRASFVALAEKANVAGGDVRISFSGAKNSAGEQPLEASVPELDLERLADLIEGFTGLTGLEGTTSLSAKGTLAADGSIKGRLNLGGQGFKATTAGGARLSLGRVTGTVDVTQGPAGDSATADLALVDVELVSGAEPGAARLNEPSVTAAFAAQRAPDESMTVSTLNVAAGPALSLSVTGPVRVSAPEKGVRKVDGKATLLADLARLAALKTFVPQLKSLTSGTVNASVEGRAAEGLDLGLGARVSNLRLAPGDLAAEGYEERDITLQAAVAQTAEGQARVTFYGLTSALLTLKSGQQPFVATRAADGAFSFAGPLDLSVNLEAVSRLAGKSMGLAPGERLGGTFTAQGAATGSPDDGKLTLTLAGRALALPASLGAQGQPASLDGGLLVTWSTSLLTAELGSLAVMGVQASGRAAMKRNADGMLFDGAEGTLSADLAQVRARLGTKMGLAPETTLSGQLQTQVTLTSVASGRRLAGTTQVANLAYQADRASAALSEQALTLEHTILLPREEQGLTQLETLRLRAGGISADLSGSSMSPAGEGRTGTLDLKAVLEGDASKLAERVRAFMGPEYKDLTGQGQLAGRFTLTGRGEDVVAGSTAEGGLTLGTWSAAGATLKDARLALRRPTTNAPYALDLTTTVNGGPTTVNLTLLPSGPATARQLAWTLKAALKDVDLSTLLVDHGAGKYLGYVLPTLVPMDQSTPVLSGKLEVDLNLQAADLAPERLRPTLAGTGRVSMTQGTLGQSTLFTSIGGGQGLGDVGKALQQVAPDVGRELGNLQRSLAFQTVLSRFTIAQQVIRLDETKLVARSVKVDLTGTVTFEQQADLAAKLWMGGVGGDALKKVLPDQTIPLRMRGPLEKPAITPDLKASDLLKGMLPGLLPKPADLLPKPADLLPGSGEDPRKKAEEEAKRLKDKLKLPKLPFGK